MAEIFPNMMKTIIHISKNFNELLPQKKKTKKKIYRVNTEPKDSEQTFLKYQKILLIKI